MDDPMIQEDETLDDLFRGRVRILQKRDGYRFSMEPILLANFASPLRGGRVIDLGTGSGVIPVILAMRGEAREVVGLEVVEKLADMASRSVRINGLEEKVRILRGDYRDVAALFPPQSFDHAISNPPYHPPGSGSVSPSPLRAQARHELSGSVEAVIEAARYLVKTKGRLWLTYPPARLVSLLACLRRHGFEPKRLRMVHGRKALPACMALLESVLGGKEGLEVLSPLILYRNGNAYTEELEGIYAMI